MRANTDAAQLGHSLAQGDLGNFFTWTLSSVCQHDVSSKPLQITGAQSMCCTVVPSHAAGQTQAGPSKHF